MSFLNLLLGRLSLRKNRAAPPPSEDDDFVAIDFARLVIVFFIVWQLMCVALWLMPASKIKTPFVPWIQAYMWCVGCDQNWNMFAPQPARQDVYLVADITYQNGSTKSWTFPRMSRQNYILRYQDERFRKMIEYAHQDSFSRMWPFVARFAALANNTEPKANPVVHVQLVRCWQDIPNPGVPMGPYMQYTFYKADYAPGSLNN